MSTVAKPPPERIKEWERKCSNIEQKKTHVSKIKQLGRFIHLCIGFHFVLWLIGNRVHLIPLCWFTKELERRGYLIALNNKGGTDTPVATG